MKIIKIGDKVIGKGKPCFIIAEAGVNHNGDLKIAKKLVDVAIGAGADAVKFQTFKSENFVTKEAGLASYQEKNIGKKESQQEMLKKLELSYENFEILKNYCDKKGIIFLSTPHSYDAVDFLDNLVPAFKFGSGELTNIPGLRYAAKKGKPMILGTGMSILEEVKRAVNEIKNTGNKQIIILHCTTNYPTPISEVNLNVLKTMKKELDCIIGYSDHTLGILTSIVAVSMGAKVIEKHFTLDKKLPGPDHKASLDPSELKDLVDEIRKVEQIFGSNEKKPTESEKEIMNLVRKSLVAHVKIPKDSIIKEDMIVIKRPGIGIQPYDIKKVIGKKAKRDINKDEIFQPNMIE